MINLVTLRGRVNGSAVVETRGENSKIRLKFRGRTLPEALTVYFVDGGRITGVPVRNGEGSAKVSNFRGLIIADRDGCFIAEGVCGMQPDALAKAKADIRMMQPRAVDTRMPGAARAGETGSVKGEFPQSEPKKGNPPTNARNAGKNGESDETDKTVKTSETGKTYETEGNASSVRTNINPEVKKRFPAGCARAGYESRRDAGALSGNGQIYNVVLPKDGDVDGSASPVTKDILNTAERLFGFQSSRKNGEGQYGAQPEKHEGEHNRRESRRENRSRSGVQNALLPNGRADLPPTREGRAGGAGGIAECHEETAENPFPKLFPDSYWKKKPGDDTILTGAAKVKGVIYDIIAVRSNNRRYPPSGLKGNLRRLTSANGKFYWAGITRRRN